MKLSARLALTFISSFVLLGFGSCNRDYHVYTVDGVHDKFCVPNANVVPDIPWVPPDRPGTPNVFAFKGCSQGDPATETCVLPKSVIGGVVYPLKAVFSGWRWQDFSVGADIHDVVFKSNSLLEVRDGGRIVVVSNEHDWRWYVWRKATPLAANAKPSLENNDQLLADCEKLSALAYASRKPQPTVKCSRYVPGKDYAVDYSFTSNDQVPKDVGMIDQNVFAQVDQWRCKK